MPRTHLKVVPLATILLIFAACAPDEATAPETITAQVARAGASGGGAVLVTEYGSPFTIVTNDPQRQLTSTLGATYKQVLAECGGATLVGDAFTYRTLTTPSGKVLEHAQAEDINVLVFAGFYEFGTDLCAFIKRTQLLAAGTADYVLTSNNYVAPPGAPGAREDNLRAQGTVTNVQTGGLFHYVVRAGSLVTGGGTDKGFRNNILLTPKR